MALIGDTVRLVVEFKNFEGVYVDPTNIQLKVYDTSKNAIGTPMAIGIESKIDTGKYMYDYTIPNTKKDLVYEFSGMYNEKPILGRGILPVEFVKGL